LGYFGEKAVGRRGETFVCSGTLPSDMRRAYTAVILSGLMALLMIPSAVAHPPPPETGGLVFTLSGASDLSLIREGVSSAESGSELIYTGTPMHVGTWASQATEFGLNITESQAILVMYFEPVGVVVGLGVYLDVIVMVDGEEVASGRSETVILNEPLMTNVPWTSDIFDLSVEVGQVIEVDVTAYLDGYGAAEANWGQADAPALFSLENWSVGAHDEIRTTEAGEVLHGHFETPWTCRDIVGVTLEMRGPVADHDAEWPEGESAEEALPGAVEVSGEGCAWEGTIEGLSGVYLHRWQVTMSDGEIFNISGWFEAGGEGEEEIHPAKLSVLGGLIGIIAVSIPLWLLAPGAGLVGLVATTSTREFDSAEVVKEPLPLTAILVIGLLTGLLAGPVIAVLALVGLLAFGWAIQGS